MFRGSNYLSIDDIRNRVKTTIQKKIMLNVTNGLGFKTIFRGYNKDDSKNLELHLNLMNIRIL